MEGWRKMITVPIPPAESGAYFGFDKKLSPKKKTVTFKKEDIIAIRGGCLRTLWVVCLTCKINPVLQQ
jgi:hypothetical protein